MWFKPGDFGFVKDEKMREILNNDYFIIENLHLWYWFKTTDFVVGNFKPLTFIRNNAHTNETFEYSMYEMKKIAKNGWDFYDMFYINK